MSDPVTSQPTAPKFDVFLSHNSKDKPAVRQLKQRLEEDGVRVWFDEEDLLPGDAPHKAIAEGLDQSRVCVVFIGAEGIGPWHDWEIGLAINQHVNSSGFRLIPVVLPRGAGSQQKFQPSDVPLWLRGLLWLEFTKLSDDTQYQRLKDAILGRSKDFKPQAIRQIEEDTEAAIVPRGLRSFGEKGDESFYLRLVPGPRDYRGLPPCITFWKDRLEQVDPHNTFRVGLMIGPSGCGKSSLVKAGLLPRLHNYIKPIYLEADAVAGRTEQRLLKLLREQVPLLPQDLSLEASLGHVVSHPECLADYKLAIFVDQFEQWLHSNPIVADSELLRAFQHCDGRHLQVVVMTRADFNVEANRFFTELGIPIQDEINSQMVDLFDREHARAVLIEYGRAYDRFASPPLSRKALAAGSPDVPNSPPQPDGAESFLSATLDQLQDHNQRLVAVKLAMFASVMKAKPWTGTILKEMGGPTGVGRVFLEEAFDPSNKTAKHRLHFKIVTLILRELLPPSTETIKGTSRTQSELLHAAQQAGLAASLEPALALLDKDLKLISLVGAEDRTDPDNAAAPATHSEEPRYQLAHDYLVPSLREWLLSKDRATWRGRVRLELIEMASNWARRKRDPKSLAGLRQWAIFKAATLRTKLQDEEKAFLWGTLRYRNWRLTLGSIVISLSGMFYYGIRFWPVYQATLSKPTRLNQRHEIIVQRRWVPGCWQSPLQTGFFADQLQNPGCIDHTSWRSDDLVDPAFDWEEILRMLNQHSIEMTLEARIWNQETILSTAPISVPTEIAQIEPSATVQETVDMLNDNDSSRREVAANHLGTHREASTLVVEALVNALDDKEPYVRMAAATSLAQVAIKTPAVYRALKLRLSDHNRQVRVAASAALVALGQESDVVISVLFEVPADSPEFVWYRIVQILGRLRKPTVKAEAYLTELLRDRRPGINAIAARSLGIVGQREVIWTDERMMADLADNDSSVRERAGIVLAYRHQKVGDNLPKPELVERIKKLRKDPRPWVRQSSLHALVHIEKRKAQLLEEAEKAKNDNSKAAE